MKVIPQARILCFSILIGALSFAQTSPFSQLRNMMPHDLGYKLALTVGDIDGDGDLDVLAGGSYGPRIYFAVGLGRFENASHLLPTWNHFDDDVTCVALGDVDGDGDLDIFCGAKPWTGEGSTKDYLYLNDGTGGFVEAAGGQLPGIYDTTESAYFVDVDLDGDLDLFLGNWGYFDNLLYENDGTGFFSDASDQIPTASCLDAGVADVDGDGDPDLLIGTVGYLIDELHLNDGTGHFSVARNHLPQELLSERAIEMVDIDRDGDADAILAGDGPVRLWLNDGDGRFTSMLGAFPGTNNTRTISVADVDGDQDLDVLASGTLYLNDGFLCFTPADPEDFSIDPAWDWATTLLDVDLDSDADVVVAARQPRLLLNSGEGRFDEVTGVLEGAAKHLDLVELVDVERDGDLDVFFGGFGGERVVLYRNDGTGGFEKASEQLPDDNADTTAMAAGDMDGDGDVDLLVAKVSYTALYRNDGAGTFSIEEGVFPSQFQTPRDLALGDVDGDGDLDALLVASVGPQLFLNDGSGSFVNASGQLPPLDDNGYSLALGDVDGDGDLDAWIGNYDQDRLLLNDGAGLFLDAAGALPVEFESATDVELGDVDRDGDLDALVVHWSYEPDRWLLNDGWGRFTDAGLSWPSEGEGSLESVELADLDEDGDLDVLLSSGWLYSNDGSGNFVAECLTPEARIAEAAALGDLDGDGDFDAAFAENYQDRVLFNLTRQLAVWAVPRAGKPLVFDLHGPPGGAWILAASRAEDLVPMRGLGTLRIDRTQVVLERVGSFGPEGRELVRLDVPPGSGLVGTTLFWQALVCPPRRLTSLERVTITDL